MRIGLMLNEPGPNNPDPIGEVTAVFAAAKDDGFSSIFMPQIFGLDTLTTFAAAGSRVDNIELVAAVMPIYTRHPLAMAQQALTTQAVVGGRLTLGVGLSHGFIVEHMFGLPFEKPVRFMDEYLDALLPLLSERKADVAGEVVRMNAAISAPAPHPVPVMLAALAPRMLKLAGARTDGTILAWTGINTVRDHVAPIVTSAAEAAGRPAPRIASMLPVCVTDDIAGARARAAKVFAHYGQLPSYKAMLDREGAANVGDVAIVGSADEVTNAVAVHADIGVTDFVVSEFGTPDENAATREALRSLALAGVAV